ncbi:hypothetical protein EDD22DRAFT_955754 [Suillus occidentalis]|nr:hypothetical protein EDD22DRAFT_955754 [Suillus occidentalis]
MNAPVDSFGMPLRTNSAAPRYGGDYTQLVNFLESVEQLAQPLGLSDKEIIKYALKYTAPNEREVFQCYEGNNNYEDFANFALFMYPECAVKRYARPTSTISAIPLSPLEAPHNAPLVSAPQHPERALEQPVAAVMAPVHEIHEIVPLPLTPEVPSIEIALTPAYIEAPIEGEPTEHQSDPEDQFDKVVSPQLEIREPTAIANAPEVLPEEITPSEVRDDSKHLLHYSAPIQEHSAVSELQNAPHLNQSMSLVHPLVTDNTAHIAYSAYSDYHAPVKHPCIKLSAQQVEHVLGDPEAPPVHPMAPDVAQVTRFEALYIHPHPISHFSLVSRFSLSRSFLSVADISPSPLLKLTIIPSLRRHSRVPNALIHAHRAPITTDTFSRYCVFIILSLLNHIPHIQHEPYFNQPSRRHLGTHLTHTYSPLPPIITFNFTSVVIIRIFHIFAYRVHIILSFSILHHPFMTRRLLCLDTVSILIIGALFSLNFTSHTCLTNTFSVYHPILTHTEDIINFALTLANAPASPAAYHAVVLFYYPRFASPWRAPDRRHQVQEFILPVTSPPLSRV